MGYWNNVSIPIDATGNRMGAKVMINTLPKPTPYSWDLYSALVLAKLLEVPTNKAILDKLPSEQVRKTEIPLTSGFFYYELLDGYGHPLLFVPSIGVSNITAGGIAGSNGNALESDGIIHVLPQQAPNPRYFWMSAGPDNDPKTGDDNHYSFDQ